MENKYTNEWFKKQALESIKSISPNIWDFSDSSLLYVNPKAVDAYEEIQKEGDPYRDLVTIPETEYISKISSSLTLELPNNFYYIDLGPGTEHKEKFLFNALKNQNKKFTYFPVDISPYILKTSKNFASELEIETKPILASFEECADYLPNDGIYRFVSIGLTFVNYNIQDIFKLFENIVDQSGSIFINSHIRERTNIQKIRDLYVAQLESMILPKIQLLNLEFKDLENIEVNDKVEVWCTIKNSSSILNEKGIKAGDKFLVFQSLRYSLDELKSEIMKTFPNYSMFDTGASFVGFLLKK